MEIEEYIKLREHRDKIDNELEKLRKELIDGELSKIKKLEDEAYQKIDKLH